MPIACVVGIGVVQRATDMQPVRPPKVYTRPDHAPEYQAHVRWEVVCPDGSMPPRRVRELIGRRCPPNTIESLTLEVADALRTAAAQLCHGGA
jgi:hypothetical protein